MAKRPFKLLELCAGSAALSCRLMDTYYPPTPYLGSKRLIAKEIIQILGWPIKINPNQLHIRLVESGCYGPAWKVMAHPRNRSRLIKRINKYVVEYAAYPRDLFTYLKNQPIPSARQRIEFAARFLILQRCSYGAKAISCRKQEGTWQWETHGMDRSALYGSPTRRNYRAIKPQLPLLTGRIQALPWDEVKLQARHADARRVQCFPDANKWVVYIDPPYIGTQGYGSTSRFPREDVMRCAMRWFEAGARVAISEAGADVYPELLRKGWSVLKLRDSYKYSISNSKKTPGVIFTSPLFSG